jgi:hypothetical protein
MFEWMSQPHPSFHGKHYFGVMCYTLVAIVNRLCSLWGTRFWRSNVLYLRCTVFLWVMGSGWRNSWGVCNTTSYTQIAALQKMKFNVWVCVRIQKKPHVPPPPPPILSLHVLKLQTYLFQNEKDQKTFVIKPIPSASVKPVLVFINPKSGGNQGAKLLQKFQWLLNPRQVFDLTQGGPKLGYVFFNWHINTT